MRHPRSILVLLLALTAGCSGAPERALFNLPPPDDWAERLVADRSARDDAFAGSSASPLLDEDRDGFGGLEYFAPDPAWYFAGELELYREPQELTLGTTSGEQRPSRRIGRIRFPVDGELHELQVYQLLDAGGGPQSLLLPFTDGTSGTETYPAGRYLDLAGPPGGPYVVDFNRAYNPSCAYGAPERFACPVTPPENRLAVRVPAGERGYKREG